MPAKSLDKFSNLKSANYLPYVMAAIWAKENKLNDALILNQHKPGLRFNYCECILGREWKYFYASFKCRVCRRGDAKKNFRSEDKILKKKI
jgi:hypothetical protein